jgi:hypothetical protein
LEEKTDIYEEEKINEFQENEIEIANSQKEKRESNFLNGLNDIVLDMHSNSDFKINKRNFQQTDENSEINEGYNNSNSENEKNNINTNLNKIFNQIENTNINNQINNSDLNPNEKEKAKKEVDNNTNSLTLISESKTNNKFLDNTNLDNSFERLEKVKLDEIDDLFSPFDLKNSNNKNLILSQNGFNLNLTQTQGNYQDGNVSNFKVQDKDAISTNNVCTLNFKIFVIK